MHTHISWPCRCQVQEVCSSERSKGEQDTTRYSETTSRVEQLRNGGKEKGPPNSSGWIHERAGVNFLPGPHSEMSARTLTAKKGHCYTSLFSSCSSCEKVITQTYEQWGKH